MNPLSKNPPPPPLPANALARPPAQIRPSQPPPSPVDAGPMPSPWDSQVVSSAPAPVKGSFGGSTWLNNNAYPLVKPEHAQELEQNAAVNEFGMKMPRAKAEAQAYGDYKTRQHKLAAAHHLAGMQAARGAGDMEAARKHGLMYNLHSKAIGHEPVGPAHPDVVAHLSENPKVYKFKPHHGDQLALSAAPSMPPPQASGVISSAPPPQLGKSEVDALNVVYAACQAVLAKAEYTKHLEKDCPNCGAKHTLPKNQRTSGPEQHCPKCAAEADKKIDEMDKGEMSPRPKGTKPCVCTAYHFPHRHKSGKCGGAK